MAVVTAMRKPGRGPSAGLSSTSSYRRASAARRSCGTGASSRIASLSAPAISAPLEDGLALLGEGAPSLLRVLGGGERHGLRLLEAVTLVQRHVFGDLEALLRRLDRQRHLARDL